MRVFLGHPFTRDMEFFDSFEDLNPEDGNFLLGGSGTQNWARWDSSINARTGSRSLDHQNANLDENLYRAITSGKNFEFVVWISFRAATPSTAREAHFQIDDGDDTDNTIHEGTNRPNNAVALKCEMQYNAGVSYTTFTLTSFFTSSGVDELTITKVDWNEPEDKWIGLKVLFTDEYFFFFTDYNDVEGWNLEGSGLWSNTATMGNMDVFRFTNEYVADNNRILVDDAVVNTVAENTDNEVKVDKVEPSYFLNEGGICQFTVRDRELATYSTYKDIMGWTKVHIKSNDLSQDIWTGWANHSKISLNKHFVTCWDALMVLKNIGNLDSTLKGEGVVSSASGTTLIDEKANFQAELADNYIGFTDTEGPSSETVYPNSNSGWVSGSPEYYNKGDHETLENVGDKIWGNDPDLIEYDIEFEVGNHASLEMFILRIIFDCPRMKPYYQITFVEQPKIEIYDVTNTTWRTLESISYTWFNHYFDKTYTQNDLPAGSPSDYFDGSNKLKIRLGSGIVAGEREEIFIYHAMFEYKYSALFDAEDQYFKIVSVDSTTQLTLDTNIVDKGIGANDRYAIGDLSHLQLDQIVKETFFAFDREVMTSVETANLYLRKKFDILKSIAKKAGCNFWLVRGQNLVKVSSSNETTGITLTEADIINFNEDAFFMTRSAQRMSKVGLAKGQGITSVVYQNTQYDSPVNFVSPQMLTNSQSELRESLIAQMTEISAVEVKFTFKIDMTNGPQDYSKLSVGKTVDINIKSDTITGSDLVILGMRYVQDIGENAPLTCLLVIGDVYR